MRHTILGFLLSLALFVSLSLPVAAYPASLDNDLCAAAAAGKTADVAALLAKGGKVDARCDSGDTPLILAAGKGHLDTVRLLISKGAKVNEVGSGGMTALADAAGAGHNDVVQLLLEAHAEVDTDTGFPLIFAAAGCQTETVNLLLAHGAKIDAHLDVSGPALLEPAEKGCVDTVQALLAAGANVNVKDPLGQTALMRVAVSGGTETVRVLLDKGADPNLRTNEGKTALIMAASVGDAESVRLLLDKGADPNARTNDGKTALMVASSSAIRDLLSKGAATGGPEGASKQKPPSAAENAEGNPSQGAGQSLAELARKERERRKSQAQATVVLTNEGVLKKEGENPQSVPKPTTQSAAGGQEAAGGGANIPATPTLSVNGKQTKLTHVIAVRDEPPKGCIAVVLSDVPVTEEDVRFSLRLADKAEKGKLHAAKLRFDAGGEVIGYDVYDPALPYGYVNSSPEDVNFHRKTFDGGTVAGTVTTPDLALGSQHWQLAGTFTAQVGRPLTEAESAQEAHEPAVAEQGKSQKGDTETEAKLKSYSPAERKALAELLDLFMGQAMGCKASLNHWCGSVDEWVKAVQKSGGETDPNFDPRRDRNYEYRFSIQGEDFAILALPRHPGLISFLLDEKTEKFYLNPSGQATSHDPVLGDLKSVAPAILKIYDQAKHK